MGLIVSRPPEKRLTVPVILVPDTLKALGDLAGFRRSKLHDLQVVAITGSSGKTTVKEMTATILATRFNVLKTKGNFNNLVGLPLTLLQADARHDVAVLEMGMNRPGEIARLAEIADPDIACIVNVQEAHLAGLHSIDGVARAKGELFAGEKAWGKLAVNTDDRRVRKLAGSYAQEKITFGHGRHALVRATHVRTLGEAGMAFTLHLGPDKARVKIGTVGPHNVTNALAAAAMAHGLGLGLAEIAEGLAAFRNTDKRLQIERLANGVRVLNDAYNANPASMLAALETIRSVRGQAKAVAVLGDMLELGESALAAHRRLGQNVAALGFDHLLAIGDFAAEMVAAAIQAGMSREHALPCAAKEEMVTELCKLIRQGQLGNGDWLVVKGSRGMKMETVVSDLLRCQG